MQTIKIELEDNIYQNILDSGVNIQEKLKEMAYDLIDDGYPSLSTKEAKKRVSDGVNRYRDGTGEYVNHNDYLKEIEKFSQSL